MTPHPAKKGCRPCRDALEERRLAIALNEDVAGIDFIVVHGSAPRPRLEVVLLGKAPEDLSIDAENVRIVGSRRSCRVNVLSAHIDLRRAGRDDVISIQLDLNGDDSPYTLEIVETIQADAGGATYGRRKHRTGRTHPAFDPSFVRAEFRLSAGGVSPADCTRPPAFPRSRRETPEINYLAKDYESFRQLILDRLSTLMPDWLDRSPADLGVTLAELLAHAGDHLSYFQDAVATEAYLRTARQRTSVRRHTRLIDYAMHEGSNARAFVCLRPTRDLPPAAPEEIVFKASPQGESQPGSFAGEPRAPQVFFEPTPLPLEPLTFSDSDLKDRRELWLWWRRPLAQRLYPSGQSSPGQSSSSNSLLDSLLTMLDDQLRERIHRFKEEQYPDQFERELLTFLTRLLLRREAADVERMSGALAAEIRRPALRMYISALIREGLLAGTQRLIDEFDGRGQPPRGLSAAIVTELNRLLESPRLREIWYPRNDDSIADHIRRMSAGKRIALARNLFEIGRHLPRLVMSPAQLHEAGLPPFTAPEAGPHGVNLHPVVRPIDLSTPLLNESLLTIWNRLLLETVYPFAIARHQTLEPRIEAVEAHNQMRIYCWGRREFTLAAGATTAALIDDGAHVASADSLVLQKDDPRGIRSDQRGLRRLQAGDIVVFSQRISPDTGLEEDADLARRQAVRLTHVEFDVDRTFNQAIVLLRWDAEDALVKPFIVSTVGPAALCCALLEDVSVVQGNVVLADHGQTLSERELLPTVASRPSLPTCEAEDTPDEFMLVPRLYRPHITGFPLAFHEPMETGRPARRMLLQDPRRAFPAVDLASRPPGPGGTTLTGEETLDDVAGIAKRLCAGSKDIATRMLAGRLPCARSPVARALDPEKVKVELLQLEESWNLARDLIGSGPGDRRFVIEIDNDRRGQLRFGDGELGRRPAVGEQFILRRYRVGDPRLGNVGAEKIVGFARIPPAWSGADVKVTNPLPADGAMAPEDEDLVRRTAPATLVRRLARAVTPEDYVRIVQTEFQHHVQRVVAVRRKTSLVEEIFVAVDPRGRQEPEPALLEQIGRVLERYRRIGHDVTVGPPLFVPLRIKLEIVVDRQSLADHVAQEVTQALTGQGFCDGSPAYFSPDNLTFNDKVRLSSLVKAICRDPGVPGVVAARALTFERYSGGSPEDLANGFIQLGPLEIARLDNDPRLPENGTLRLVMIRETVE